jgi:hypothetical protein
LSGIENLDSSPVLILLYFSLGTHPKIYMYIIFYMAEALEPESEPISRKKEINSDSSTPPIRNLTPVTIMVADTIVTSVAIMVTGTTSLVKS